MPLFKYILRSWYFCLFVPLPTVFLILISLYSSEGVRLVIIQHQLDRKNFDNAEEIVSRVLRKRFITGTLDRRFLETFITKWDSTMTLLIKRELAIGRKEWDNSRSFFGINQIHLMGLVLRFERIRALVGPGWIEDMNAWKILKNFISIMMPYSIDPGFKDNDTDIERGSLNFNCGEGGIALDYNLRSIGANLRYKKPVIAIRLNHLLRGTRVTPENLSLWISDDNKLYRRYDGKARFSKETNTIIIDQLDFTCQYLKIHCDFNDESFTFSEDCKKILEVYGPPDLDRVMTCTGFKS